MRGQRRVKRDMAVILISAVVLFGIIMLGVEAVNRFPHLYEDFAAWKWRIFLGMAVLPLTILGFACGAFALLGWLMRSRGGGPIS
jgi:hypothetical protein